MSGRKTRLTILGFVLSVSLIASAVSVAFASRYYNRRQYELLNVICGGILKQEPEAVKIIAAVLKEYTVERKAGRKANENIDWKADGKTDENIDQEVNGKTNENTVRKADVLSTLGYGISDFSTVAYGQNLLFMAAGFAAGVMLFICTFQYRNRKESARIHRLTDYLQQVNSGRGSICLAFGEDDFSKLEDELYKTVTFLYQTRDAAVQAKNGFAENLSNIAHQIKTPITSISLSVQMMKQNADNRYLEQVNKQLLRLARLEEALLVLSRLDAGTLLLQKEEADVFTLLVLAADNLQELFSHAGVFADIPESGQMRITVDREWTIEAIMNLMKNCMEYSNGGKIHCSYAQNPLYTEILIRDEGEGFAKEDIPHLFERFYRGKNRREGGIGIGLALSKEIIERQNGTVRARNLPEGGACFEIRFYRH